MGKPLERPQPPDLYEADFYAWTQDQAARLRARTHNAVDWDNLAEEIESVGIRELREIRNWYEQLLRTLLLWELRPDERCHSWQSAISEARIFLEGKYELSPSLAARAEERIALAYHDALRSLTWMRPELKDELPRACPWSATQLSDTSFMPGRPWSPDELLLD